MVRAWGLEPQRKAREPKSRMSTNSIMPAYQVSFYHGGRGLSTWSFSGDKWAKYWAKPENVAQKTTFFSRILPGIDKIKELRRTIRALYEMVT